MANMTYFNLMVSEKNQQDGSIKYVNLYPLSPMAISSCEISTESHEEKIEYGPKADIMPLGVRACGATITGTFAYGGSDVIPATRTVKEVKDFENTIKIFTEIENAAHEKTQQTYALKLIVQSPASRTGTRELAGGIWKIKSFSWDRKAKELGKYRFNMELGYFWEYPAEQKIFDAQTASKKEQTCSFCVNVYKTTNAEQTDIVDGDIFNTKINKSLHVKNTAIFDYTKPLLKDSLVIINKRNAVREDDKDVFFGIVTECESNSKDGAYTVRCKEIGDLLYRGVCSPIGSLGFLFPRVVINTPDSNKLDYTISRMVREILETYYTSKTGFEMFVPGSGYDATHYYGSHEYLPGRGDPHDATTWVKICTQVLSSVSVGTAITNFLYHQCGMYVWFNYKKKGALEYGFLRDGITLDITKEVIETTTLTNSGSDDVTADGVIVWSPDAEYTGCAGDIGPDKHMLVYTYTDSKPDLALEAIAYKILEYNKLDCNRIYTVRFPAGTVRFKEGDYFKGLGDSIMTGTQKMDYKSGTDANPLEEPGDSVWHIKEVVITEEFTEVQVGTSYYSILDVYKTILQRNRDGVTAPVEQKLIRCNPVEVGGNT